MLLIPLVNPLLILRRRLFRDRSLVPQILLLKVPFSCSLAGIIFIHAFLLGTTESKVGEFKGGPGFLADTDRPPASATDSSHQHHSPGQPVQNPSSSKEGQVIARNQRAVRRAAASNSPASDTPSQASASEAEAAQRLQSSLSDSASQGIV